MGVSNGSYLSLISKLCTSTTNCAYLQAELIKPRRRDTQKYKYHTNPQMVYDPSPSLDMTGPLWVTTVEDLDWL